MRALLSLVLLVLTSSVSGDSLALQARDFFSTNEHSLLKASEAFKVRLGPPRDGGLDVVITVAPGYYAYRDKIKIEGEGANVGSVQLPPAKRLDDPALGNEWVYDGTVMIGLDGFTLPPGAEGVVHVKLQGCHPGAQVCYPPQSYSFPVRRVKLIGGDRP